MKRTLILAALLATACGGGGSKPNPATTTTFNYPSTGTTASSTSTLAATSALTSLSSLSGSASPDVSTGTSAGGALYDAANKALGGNVAFAAPVERVLPLFRQARSEALLGVSTGTLPAGCGTIAGGTISFDPAVCAVTDNSTPGETVRGSLSGHVTRVSAGAAEWALVLTVAVTSSQGSLSIEVDDSGNFAVTATTAKAHEEAALHATMSASGQTMSFGVAQAADLDATLDASCATHVGVPSTFEAKRVWTAVPQQLRDQNPTEFQNKGVKLVWTGCGTANAFFASN